MWQEAAVVEHVQEAVDTARIVFRLEQPMDFIPGQYVNLRLRFPERDKPVQRSYSIASAPDISTNTISVIVTKVPGGLVSTELVDQLRVGDVIDARGPYGKFTWADGDAIPVFMIAAGSGVVPFLSMLDYISARRLDINATLLLSARTRAHVIGADVYNRIDPSLKNVRVITTYTRDPDDSTAEYHRRIDGEMLQDLHAVRANAFYICGPDEMVHTARANLCDLGIDESLIQTEIYP